MREQHIHEQSTGYKRNDNTQHTHLIGPYKTPKTHRDSDIAEQH